MYFTAKNSKNRMLAKLISLHNNKNKEKIMIKDENSLSFNNKENKVFLSLSHFICYNSICYCYRFKLKDQNQLEVRITFYDT